MLNVTNLEAILFRTCYRCRVRLLSIEMEGTFGRVYRGSYHEEGASTPRDVLVKTAAEHASQSQVSNFFLTVPIKFRRKLAN